MGVSEPSLSPWVRRMGWASLVANLGLIVTGGAVRLTGSGLGCPTWPRCTSESFTPHGALDLHSAIEFGNRTLTFVLAAVAIGTFWIAWRSRRSDLTRLALLLGLAIPAQALLGGLTVLTHLNPWVVSLHLLPSLGIVSLAVVFLWRIDHPAPVIRRGALTQLAWWVFGVAWAVFYVGTVVTGAGPHAGDSGAARNGLDPLEWSQAHADLVFLLLGLTLGLVYAVRVADTPPITRRAALVLLLVELSQGLIGFVQYFTHLPVLVVGLHMLGSGLTAAAVTWALLTVRESGREESGHKK
ncbi:MAG: COX15/CtaA family protein [Nocardioides sp.]|uniref:COX15/CtaA family protein n=1 Tax=Nocardioides sp. TaxID=35761 RepID=UPI0039E3CABF